MRRLLASTVALAVASCVHPDAPRQTENLHNRILTLDTHLDTPLHFSRPGWRFGDRHSKANDLAQVDLPRMEDGALDGGFFAIYTGQGTLDVAGYATALAHARRRSDEIDTTLAAYPNRIGAAVTADDALRLHRSDRLIAFKSIENSYPLGENLTLLDEFHRRGVRLAGPVHGANNQFADSATDKPRWNGLSPLGRQWVGAMNRLGMVIDASHASDLAFDQMLALSRSPLLLSHSGARSVFDHPRNLDDERLRALARQGGAICYSTIYLSPLNLAGERAALFDRFEKIGTLSPADQEDLARQWHALDRTAPLWNADFERYMAGLLYLLKLVGPDHVCFGADWDGGGGLPGLEDISAHPKITTRLKAAGYSDADIEKMWSGNVLRILQAARSAATVKGR